MPTPGDVLTRDHRALEAMLQELLDAPPDRRPERFRRAADHLTAHVTVEEQLFYPQVRARATEGVLLESLEEHLSLKRLVADLLAMAPGDPRFEAKVHVLKEQAEHHHEEEERHLFPKLSSVLDRPTLDAMGADLEQALRTLDAAELRETVLDQTKEAATLA